MDAKELRLGNWINEQGLELQVGMIQKDMFHGSEPIPLTKEWLLKFGFELNDGEYAIEYNRFNLSKPNNYYGYLLSDGLKGIKPILYVHELQNIYFYLTNKELCIQEE